ncbi:exo-beta-1,3-glucanase [Planoprotostelium fungivorum]|uniref:Exo-beta-1,3-glucanase n=1 Tax=Planoprotostelium fungivorum TaxID=1890364 RepID=A0A2P6NGV3_9EUKA|nr:exo-beta-1,3-glucanase [Planoprotostelium fungivorum]
MRQTLYVALLIPCLAASVSSYWYENVLHNGISPFMPNTSAYTIFRSVLDYGADPTGTSDSYNAFNNAVRAGNGTYTRASSGYSNNLGSTYTPGYNYLGASMQTAIIYIPGGTYLIGNGLQLFVNTIIIGDPTNPPTLKLTSGFNTGWLFYGKDLSYNSPAALFMQIKNIRIDSTPVSPGTLTKLIDWSVGVGCYISNVNFTMPRGSSSHYAIAIPYGLSSLILSNINIIGGNTGILLDAAQQLQMKSISFNGTGVGITIKQCFNCLFTDMSFYNVAVGVDMTSSTTSASPNGDIGALTLMDTTANSVGTLVKTVSPSKGGDHTLILQNVQGYNVTNMVDINSGAILVNGTNFTTNAWVYGYTYTLGSNGSSTIGTYPISRDPSLLNSVGEYVTLPCPTFVGLQAINVKNVTGYPVAGNGYTDDTINLQYIISNYINYVLYFPAGTYRVTQTLFFPPNSRIHGEGWSTLSAWGPLFNNASAPVPLALVGNPGDVGVAQFVDMQFTVGQPLPGCILMRVNMAGNNPGDVGLWNTYFRVGGIAGSWVLTNCTNNCQSAYLSLHLTNTSSSYLENVLGIAADRDIDYAMFKQNVSAARGILIESRLPTWLHGTSFQHHALYQYNFRNVNSLFVGLHHTEGSIFQGQGAPSNLMAPSGWTINPNLGDPDFSNCPVNSTGCRMAWHMYINRVSGAYLYGTSLNSVTNNGVACLDNTCQQNAAFVGDSRGIVWMGINTHYAQNMISFNSGNPLTSANNTGPFGGLIGLYLHNVGPITLYVQPSNLSLALSMASQVSVGATLIFTSNSVYNTPSSISTSSGIYLNMISTVGAVLTSNILVNANSTFNGMTFSNSTITFATSSPPSFSGCNFYASNVTVLSNLGLTINNCNFVGASGVQSTAILYSGGGSVSVFGSTFSNYNSMYGAIYASQPISLYSTNFTGNSGPNGAALYLDLGSSAVINNCVFTNNVALVNGGAIYNAASSLTITGSSFYSNSALRGGALYLSPSQPNQTVTLTGSYFERNYASQGGVLFTPASNTILFTSSQFVACYSTTDGGVIYNSGSFTGINNSSSLNTYALGDGGFIRVVSGGVLMMSYSNVTNANAQNGGAIRADGGTNLSLLGLTLSGCVANQGGAIHSKGLMTFRSTTLYNNSALLGGGLYLDVLGTAYVSRGIFQNNNCTTAGCAVYVAGSLVLAQSVMVNNNGKTGSCLTMNHVLIPSGSAVMLAGGRVIAQNSTISYNQATVGGVVQIDNGHFIISGGMLFNNTGVSPIYSGVFGIDSGTATISNCGFTYITGRSDSNVNNLLLP